MSPSLSGLMKLKGIAIPRGTALLPLALLGGLAFSPRSQAQVAAAPPPVVAALDVSPPLLLEISAAAPPTEAQAKEDPSLDELTVALLAQAAHSPWAHFQKHAVSLPQGWEADLDHSGRSADGINHFITFHNDRTKQVVIAFRGTNSFSQLRSDVFNDGGAAWESLRGELKKQMPRIRQAYPDFQIVTDGHSLGGGMAQTAALEYGLDGYGQNSTPISGRALKRDFPTRAAGIKAIAAWRAAGHVFRESNQRGDWVTFYYRTLRHRHYLEKPADALVLARPSRPSLKLPIDVLHPHSAHTIATIIKELASRNNPRRPAGLAVASTGRPGEDPIGHAR